MSFRIRLFISFTLLIAITFGLGGAIVMSSSFHTVLEKEKTAAHSSFETVQTNLMMLDFFGEQGDYENMRRMLEQMEQKNLGGWQALSLTKDTQVIYESGEQDLLATDLALEETTQYASVVKMDANGRRIQMYSKIASGGEHMVLRASYDLSNAYSLRESQQKIFLVTYVVVIGLGIGFAGVLSFVLTRRLNRLTDTVQHIADGELTIRSRLHTGDEFEQLSKDVDTMADHLQDNIEKLEAEVKRQEAFMGAVAHELKTPMTSIIGYADLLRQCALDEKEQMDAANYIYSEGQRLEKLSRKILDLLLLEKDSADMRKVNMENFLADAMRALQPLAKTKGIELQWESENAKVTIEPDLVKSLLYNLVDNAIKSTLEGGKVKVKGYEIAGGCAIEVTDNGCGMEEEELSKITEAFYRVDKSRSRQQGGVGLGLTLCKKIVDLHHGSMTFQSTKGMGSRVIVELYVRENMV